MYKIFTPNGWKWNVELLSKWLTSHINKPFLHTLVISNSTPTVVSASNTHYKAVGTFVVNPNSRDCTATNGEFKHTWQDTLLFDVSASVNVSAGNNQTLGLHIGKNGVVQQYTETTTTTSGNGKAESISLKGIVSLAPNDYVELFLENKTAATNIVMNSASVVMKTI